MARKNQTRGKCNFCQKEMTREGLVRHLSSCKERQRVIEKATGRSQQIYHLQIQDAIIGDFWLHIEIGAVATLKNLDHYLRWIWLECCGHLSQFSVGGWHGEEFDMDCPIGEIFTVGGDKLTHIYDFGTESQSIIKAVAIRDGKPLSKNPIFLMARNNIPEVTCMECDKPATWLCTDCMWEAEVTGLLCDTHNETHVHPDVILPFVNSPRTGLCGYDGPAEPPY
ncbi:hypothetical protein QUF58_14145 [Anaerolineales bacterium HSG24]|nr:hypothetical protein [Anaerolineales bacterium HSG24]